VDELLSKLEAAETASASANEPTERARLDKQVDLLKNQIQRREQREEQRAREGQRALVLQVELARLELGEHERNLSDLKKVRQHLKVVCVCLQFRESKDCGCVAAEKWYVYLFSSRFAAHPAPNALRITSFVSAVLLCPRLLSARLAALSLLSCPLWRIRVDPL
jgi:hypothetical protein